MDNRRKPVSQKKLIVAAIDFGTTYSGYAYSFLDEFKTDRLKSHANTKWLDGQAMATLKTPTVILFDKDGNFDSFGFEAETKYAALSSECTEESKDWDFPVYKHIGWRYFTRFKMELFKRKRLRLDMKLKDDQNNTMLAIDVFAASIRFLKDHMLKRMSERLLGGITESDIQWVITVPAIWQNAAKQFMQEAAERAGIPEGQVCLALEPEAAALYCKEIIVSKANEHQNESKLHAFRSGAQFMILDMGGGTVDITAHEVQNDGTLKELTEPRGGPWGGTLVDLYFDKYFEDLFGNDVMAKFKKECKADELDLKRTLEMKKRLCKGSVSEEENRVIIQIPSTLFEYYRELRGKQFSLPNNSEVSILRGGKLRFEPTIFHAAFEEAKTNIISHVKSLLDTPFLKNVKTILMVGGFSESEILKQAIKKEFEGTKSVILPDDAAIAVIKGAVIYGHESNSISSRVLRHTYGISIAIPFDPSVHPTEKKQTRENQEKCEDVFKVFIRKGAIVSLNNTKVTHTVNAPTLGASRVTIEIYQSDSTNPVFVTEDGCQKVADVLLTLKQPSAHDKKKIDITMWFGDTVLHVDACEQDTNNKVSAKFNFLI